jgi:hypothetical protein
VTPAGTAGTDVRRRAPLLLVLGCLLSLLVGACGSTATTQEVVPCNEDPWECPAHQDCWPQSASTFACVNEGPAAVGASCANSVGIATCNAGLACFQLQGQTTGTCVPYCSTTDESHACSGGDVCMPASLGGSGGPSFDVCVPPSTGATDAGASG